MRLLSLGLFLLSATALAAQEPTQIKATETPWTVTCQAGAEGKMACEMTKQLLSANQMIAQVTLLQSGEGLAMRVIAPHQLAIAGNLAVSIDGQDAGAKAFTTSVPAGIVALFAFEDAALEAARNGKDLKFAAKSITSQDFSFSFSLAGFSAALAKLRQ